MRRVVITGLGMVTPLGCGVAPTWERILAGKSGIRPITEIDVSDLPCRIFGKVPTDPADPARFNPDDWMCAKEQRKVDHFILYAIAAARQAIEDSGWVADTEERQNRSGVLIGSGIGGIKGIEQGALLLAEKSAKALSPFFIPGRLVNLASGYVSIEHKFKGPNHSVVTACATGAHALGDAARLIALDDADVMIAGGTESCLSRLGIAGFAACRALSTRFNDTPERASRPYDKDRDGFVMGEGAGIVVLEERRQALARGAHIYAELIGYGLSGDAHHITAPSRDGDGALRCMRAALKRANVTPEEIDYVNGHGTSTPLGDEVELNAVQSLMGNAADRLSLSSTKSSIGHLLGAAGAVEAIFSILALRDGIIPPTLNLETPCCATPIDLVPQKAKKKDISVVLSNSFGFGGTNAALVFSKP